jgi:heme oxygenase (biliverdin-IX-beta and delta-forming)
LGSVRAHLRCATTERHAALDACVTPLLSEGASEYGRFLRGTAAALFPIEDALEAASIDLVVPDWNERSRRQTLTRDLAEFGGNPPTPTPFAAIPTDAYAFGVLYVLEGSRLGAASLARLVAGHADTRVHTATRYLNHGAGLKLWPRFVAQLETSEPVRNAPQQAVSGAIAAFDAFTAAFKAARA